MAGIKEQIRAQSSSVSVDGKTPQETYRLVSAQVHRLVDEQYQVLNQMILPQLAEQGIRFFASRDVDTGAARMDTPILLRELMPVLTPIGLDTSHPFPKVLNKV